MRWEQFRFLFFKNLSPEQRLEVFRRMGVLEHEPLVSLPHFMELELLTKIWVGTKYIPKPEVIVTFPKN